MSEGLLGSEFHIQQRKEWGEILLDFESRNKYQITRADGEPVVYAAEQGKGFLGFIGRQLLGHWRTFEIHMFSNEREPLLVAKHPFRWFFRRLELTGSGGAFLGAIQQRFGLLRRKFDLQDAEGKVIAEVRSPIWSPWTFPIKREGRQVALIKKKWGGLLKEAFTDADKFRITIDDPAMGVNERLLLLTAGLFVDLIYFERKKS